MRYWTFGARLTNFVTIVDGDWALIEKRVMMMFWEVYQYFMVFVLN